MRSAMEPCGKGRHQRHHAVRSESRLATGFIAPAARTRTTSSLLIGVPVETVEGTADIDHHYISASFMFAYNIISSVFPWDGRFEKPHVFHCGLRSCNIVFNFTCLWAGCVLIPQARHCDSTGAQTIV